MNPVILFLLLMALSGQVLGANQGQLSSQFHTAPPAGQFKVSSTGGRAEDPNPYARAHWLFPGLELAEGHDSRKGKFTMNSHGGRDEQVVSRGANTYLKDLSLLTLVALLQVCL